VAVDYLSLSEYPYEMPLDRGLLAQVVRMLDGAGAKAIGLDFIFDRPSDNDALLVDAIRNAQAPVVLGAIDRRMHGIGPYNLAFQQAFFARAGHPPIGHVFLHPEQQGMGQPDQTVRLLPPQGTIDEIPKSFAEALLEASGGRPKDVGELIAWLDPRAEDGAETFNTFLIPPHRPEDATADVILRPEWRDSIRGKVVIVGGNFDDRDRHLTPMSVVDGRRVAGALIQAQILAQLIDGRALRGLSFAQEFSLAVALALFGFLAPAAADNQDFHSPLQMKYGTGVL